jgi:hypothetical protein
MTPLSPQKLALTSPTGGGRSVGIVRSRTKAMRPWSLVYVYIHIFHYLSLTNNPTQTQYTIYIRSFFVVHYIFRPYTLTNIWGGIQVQKEKCYLIMVTVWPKHVVDNKRRTYRFNGLCLCGMYLLVMATTTR